ncbi:stability/partitioning determinant [Roseomonas frigidaquae]|uniref:Stability/partitioning determinant n=1 Tax=Falsiroseomonas frigidaquae TaxID=487318 RepID=A0ABX1F8I9_9PROT|nr:stability/partitioning determinant [Falsiroseomonas frigidaquae]NKE48672.1 stability/partitioning determinant [Falsiroseomonas frigidaquae]
MSGGRAPLFGQDADLDLSGFKPKAAAKPDQVRDVAEQAGFRSREASPPLATTTDPAPREPRRYRTGRNVQLNLKVRRETVDAFYKIADQQGWVLGEAFERAVAALQRDLGDGSRELSEG